MNHPADPQLHIPEILAPAGTEEAMKAAVNAGCDAVYLGGTLFSARAFAGNFDQDAVIRSLDYCHLFGVKIYMTVNTLLKEDEIGVLAEYMRPFYEAGLDGVIVQDVGVIRALKREFPDLPLHGSTQMSIASAYGAELLKKCGLRRVVPARELTLEEIREIKAKVDIEIESFVHGAMCYAYSGKCLFSSFLGGRSGNRGRCAQPCRQLYEIGTQGGQKGHVSEYIMSMKDMCTLTILPELIEAGIDSFKIEGRMKNPYYVAATVDAYCQARDQYLALKEGAADSSRSWEGTYQAFVAPLVDRMQDIYNRGGFGTGYYFPQERKSVKSGKETNTTPTCRSQDRETHYLFRAEKGLSMIARTRPNHTGLLAGSVEKVQGPDVSIRTVQMINQQDVLEIEGTGIELTSPVASEAGSILVLKGKKLKKIRPGMKVFRTRNNHLLEEIEQNLIGPEKKIPAEAVVEARLGSPLRITIVSEDRQTKITAEGSTVEAASSKPSTAEALTEKMQKTGGTHLELTVTCLVDEGVFVPMSELNQLRREAIDTFKQEMIRKYHR